MYATVQNNYTQLAYNLFVSSREIVISWVDSNLFYIGRFIMIKKTFVSLLATLFFASTIAVLTGCNTIAGAGKDVEQGGKAVKDEANEHK